jgi:small subunit ribosomal protein S14
MAKKSSIEKNKRRRKLVAKFAAKRAALKATANDSALPQEERFAARLKLAALPRNSAKIRVRNRCEITGRPRGFYRKFRMSRIALRELASAGYIPGVVKSSW